MLLQFFQYSRQIHFFLRAQHHSCMYDEALPSSQVFPENFHDLGKVPFCDATAWLSELVTQRDYIKSSIQNLEELLISTT